MSEKPLCGRGGNLERAAPSPGALVHISKGMENRVRPQRCTSVTQDLLGHKQNALLERCQKHQREWKKLLCSYRQRQLNRTSMHMTDLYVPFFKMTCYIVHSRCSFGGPEGKKIGGPLYGLSCLHAEDTMVQYFSNKNLCQYC